MTAASRTAVGSCGYLSLVVCLCRLFLAIISLVKRLFHPFSVVSIKFSPPTFLLPSVKVNGAHERTTVLLNNLGELDEPKEFMIWLVYYSCTWTCACYGKLLPLFGGKKAASCRSIASLFQSQSFNYFSYLKILILLVMNCVWSKLHIITSFYIVIICFWKIKTFLEIKNSNWSTGYAYDHNWRMCSFWTGDCHQDRKNVCDKFVLFGFCDSVMEAV